MIGIMKGGIRTKIVFCLTEGSYVCADRLIIQGKSTLYGHVAIKVIGDILMMCCNWLTAIATLRLSVMHV